MCLTRLGRASMYLGTGKRWFLGLRNGYNRTGHDWRSQDVRKMRRLGWVTCERHDVANAEGVEMAAERQIRGRHN